jgi:hypothetical protein
MKWLVIWICACNDNLEVVYAAKTEHSARSVVEALYEDDRVQGSYFVAYMNANKLHHDPVLIWEKP